MNVVSSSPDAVRRPRNPRGQGPRLREEIRRAGVELLEETGSPDAVTLRAVARRVGIAAPSIYAHFADRDAMHGAMCDAGFDELMARLRRALDPISADRPVERLQAGCRAYLGFAAERPELYRLMFGPEPLDARDATARPPAEDAAPEAPDAGDATPAEPEPLEVAGAEGPAAGAACPPGEMAFRILVDAVTECARLGHSTSRHHWADAANLWVALHGLATLRAGRPGFPWPPYNAQVDQLIRALARLDD